MALEYSIVLREGTADELRLEGVPADPESCVLLQEVQGLDSREIRETIADLASRDGDYLGDVRQAGLTLIVEAVIVGVDRADLREREAALRRALAPTSTTWVCRIDGRVGDPEDLIAQVRTSSPLRSADSVQGPGRVKAATFGLRSGDAVLYGASERIVTIYPTIATAGMTFPMRFPVSFAGSVSLGTTVTNAGDADTWPLLRVYGPVVNPTIQNVTTGLQLVVVGTIDADTFIQIDPATRAVTLGGNPDLSRYAMLDRTASSFWPLVPGANAIRLLAASFSGTARVELTYRDAYL